MEIEPERADAVDQGGPDDLFVDRAQTGQEQGHDEARRLPDPGHHHRIDGHLRIDQPVEFKIRKSPVPNHLFDAQAGIEKPFPGGAGDDEAERHGVQVDGADNALGADLLVQQDRQQQADHNGDGDEQHHEDEQVIERHVPAWRREQPVVLLPSDQLVFRQNSRLGEGHVQGPADEAVNEEQHGRARRRDHDLRQMSIEQAFHGVL